MTDSGVLFLADSVIYHVAYSVHSEGGKFFRLFRVRLHPLRSSVRSGLEARAFLDPKVVQRC